MAKKKQFVTAAAAFAVAASAVAPAITADAASQTVRLKTDYVRSANLDAVLDKEYQGSEIHWYKSSIDLNKLGVFQTAKGFVKGKGIKVEKSLRVLNYVKAVQPAKEIVLEQGVPASGLRIQPVLFADGNLYEKPVSVQDFNTDKVGEFEGSFTYANKAFGSVTTKVKYKVVASKVAFSEVKHEVEGDMLSVSADVANLKDGEKVELVIFPGKDESAALPAIEAEVKDGKVMASAKDIPAGTHSFILRSGDVKTAAMEFKVEAPMVKEVKAINAKTLEVKLNTSIESLKDVVITTKRGDTNVVLSAELNAEKNAILLTSASKLVAGEYSVAVKGGVFGEETATVKTNVAAEMEKELVIVNDSLMLNGNTKLAFQVKNQYGELMPVSASQVLITAYDKTSKENQTPANVTGDVSFSPVAAKSEFTFTNLSTDNHLQDGDELLLNITYKGLSVSKTVNVLADASVSSLSLEAPKPLEGKTRITAGETLELPYISKDQYGKDYKLPTYSQTAGDSTDDDANIGDFRITSSNPSVVDADSISVDSAGKMTFVAAGAGKTTLVVVNVKTGESSSVQVEVSAVAAPDRIELSVPSELIVAGEKVKVPYTVYDQYGDVIKPENLNTSLIAPSSSVSAKATFGFEGKELVINGVSAGETEISATVTASGKQSKFKIDVVAAAVATKIVGVKNVATILTDGASTTLSASNFQVKDQYNRDYKLKSGESVKVYLEDGTETSLDVAQIGTGAADVTAVDFANAGTVSYNSASEVTLTGKSTTGTEKLVFALDNSSGLVSGSEFKLDVVTKAATDVTNYVFEEVPTLYDATNDTIANAGSYAKSLNVTAKDANGNVVAIPASNILSITSSNTDVAIVDKTAMKIAGKGKGTATISILVRKGDGSTQTLTQVVTVDDSKPVAQTVEFDDSDDKVSLTATNAATISTITGPAKLTITDQYGGTALVASDIVTTTLTDADNNNTYAYASGVVTVTNGAAGDKFVLTAVSNGKTDTLEVTVIPN